MACRREHWADAHTTVCDHSLGMLPAIARARRDGLIYALIASAGDGAALADAVGVDVGAGRHGPVGGYSRSLVPCVGTHGP